MCLLLLLQSHFAADEKTDEFVDIRRLVRLATRDSGDFLDAMDEAERHVEHEMAAMLE